MHRSRFVHQTQVLSAEISRYLCFCNEFSRDAFGREHENGTFAAGLPGIHDVNLVIHTMGEGSSPRRWSRGPCKAEKPTQGAPARAQKPTQGAPARAHLPELVSKFAVLDHHLGSFMPTASAKRGQPRDVWRHTNRTNPGRKSSREPRRAAARRPACCPRQAPRVSTRSPDGDPRFCVRSARAGVGAPAAPGVCCAACRQAAGGRGGRRGGDSRPAADARI